ncbi:MAG: sugar ABC transporter ATP-binding protein [Mycobacterium sp.]|nr:sugar ABC transporter ATP-binding protein [Mycobacterium sp.]
MSKAFGANRAVKNVDLHVAEGTIHALVGENGAGKSTVLGMISGRLPASSGELTVFGTPLKGGNPREVRELGLAAVYQELTMVPALDAVANVFLGQPLHRAGILDTAGMRARYAELCAEFEVSIPADMPSRELSVSSQQVLEIMRGVQAKSRVLMLDEPSAALAEAERDMLYRILNRLRASGTTIIFVSHNLEEVLALSDHITVLREGSVVRTAPRNQWDRQQLIRAMVGRDVAVSARSALRALGPEVLQVRNVTPRPGMAPLNLTVRQGEIVGLWGLVGSGRTRFMRSVCGLEPGSSGEMMLRGKKLAWPASPRAAIAAGLAHVPESRRGGLVMNMSGATNYWLGRSSHSGGWLLPATERAGATPLAEYFGFNPRRLGEEVGRLSGGNQQKVLLAKWAGHSPSTLFIDEPTRGIDIGAKSEVLASLVTLAEQGASVVVTSSELEEVLAIADRLLVFSHGRIVGEINSTSEQFTVPEIVKLGFKEDVA